MNISYKIIFGLILSAIGLFYICFHTKIVSLQGESKKGDFSISERKIRLIIIGVAALIVGMLIVFKSN